MLSEIILIHHPDNIVLILWVLLHDIVEVLSLLVGKFMIHLCITGDLYCVNWLLWVFVIHALYNLSE